MKFMDKFVLVPIERYERLTKSHSTIENKEEDKLGEKESPPHFGGGEQSENKQEVTSENNQLIPSPLSHEGDGVGLKEEKEKIFPLNKKKQQIRKIPPPPPGIPNRLKTNFRWLKLKRKGNKNKK
jgi:hypothetical protein